MRLVRRHPVLSILSLLVVVLLVGVGAWAAVLNHRLGDIPRFDAGLDRPDRPMRVQGEAMNILLVGVDDGQGRDLREQLQGAWVEGSFRSDTMMVWHLSADRRTSQVVSLPRDSWVDIPGRGSAKLNAAFSYGGPQLLVRTLEESLGLYVDHVAVIDFAGFADVTRTLGGVDVPMPGGATERLEGADALAYVRERKSLPNGDFDRIDRQQNFLRAVLRQTASGATRTNPMRVTGLTGDLAELLMLDSDFDNGELRDLGLTVARHGPGEFAWLTAPTDGTGMVEGQSVVHLDIRATRRLFAAVSRDGFDSYRQSHEVDHLPAPSEVG